ncbi:MAG: Rieske 2Fe-2S domain-containing protein [Thermoplasmatales archaeon]
MTYERVGISTKIFEKTNHYITWLNSRPILVAKVEGKYYAMDAVCSHMGCALLENVSGKYAECPAHGAKYDIITGERVTEAVVRPEAKCEYDNNTVPLKTFLVKESNGFLEIEM